MAILHETKNKERKANIRYTAKQLLLCNSKRHKLVAILTELKC